VQMEAYYKMQYHYEGGDALKAERIAVSAHRITRVMVVHGSSAHKTQSATLRDSAFCVIEKPLKTVSERRR
jgi:hypothetical protein